MTDATESIGSLGDEARRLVDALDRARRVGTSGGDAASRANDSSQAAWPQEESHFTEHAQDPVAERRSCACGCTGSGAGREHLAGGPAPSILRNVAEVVALAADGLRTLADTLEARTQPSSDDAARTPRSRDRSTRDEHPNERQEY